MLPFCSLVVASLAAAAAAPPNLVFLLSESLDGRLLRPDSAAKIPNIRKLLASGSVRFDSAYSNNPVCAPSRSSLFSGRAPHDIPHMHNGFLIKGVWNNYEGLDESYENTTMDKVLAGAGYAVSLQGKMDTQVGAHTQTCRLTSLTFNVPWPYNVTNDGGWNQEDAMCASPGPVQPGGSSGPQGSVWPADWSIMQRTAAFAATAAQPFFAYAGTTILHPPYATNEFWYSVAAETPVPAWPSLQAVHPCDLQSIMKRGCAPGSVNRSAHDAFYSAQRVARVRRVYLAQLEEWDAMVGTVVEAVAAAGRAGNTVYVLAADHGDMQLEHQMFYKMVPYDASSRVPLVIASPTLTGSRTIAQPVQLLDIFPTLAALAGVSPAPPYLQGHDLAPFLTGDTDPSRPPYVLIQNADEDQSMSWFALVNGTHKLVQYGTGQEVPPQLFDLTADSGSEAANLAPAHPEAVAALDASLRSLCDYPSVALDIALYQKQQLGFWRNSTPDWRAVAASEAIRWHPAWSAAPEAALAALEAYLQDPQVTLLPCSGALARG